MRFPLAALVLALGLLLGVAGLVYGEADDSPGLQGLGVLIALSAIVASRRVLHSRRRDGS